MLFGSTLNRMIFAELVKVFLLTLGSVTGFFVLVGLIDLGTRMGLSLIQVVSVSHLFVPSMLPYTIPATTLFASCVVYGRLAHDNEIVAIKAAGVHLFALLKPAIALGALTSAITAGLYYSLIAETQQQLQQEILKDPEEVLYSALRKDRCLRHPNSDFVMYVRDVQGRRLLDVVLKKRAKTKDKQSGAEIVSGYDFIFRARVATLRVDPVEGMMYIDPDRFVIYSPTTQGTSDSVHPVPVKLPDNFNANDARTRPMSLTWDELLPRVEELRGERRALDVEREESRRKALGLPESDFRQMALAQDASYKAKIDNMDARIRSVEAELYMRPSLAFGCFVFALIGCPVGLWATRADYLSTFVICFLPTVIVYYPLMFAGMGLGKDGKIPLGLGCWMANVVVGGIGGALTWRLLRR